MPQVVVIDASVWVTSLMTRDASYAAARTWLENYRASGGLQVAPVLLLIEIAGAVVRRTGRPQFARRACDELLRAPELRLVPIDHELGQEATQIAIDLGMRAADALYVALAHKLHAPLVSLDREQAMRADPFVKVVVP
ncbi:MAG: type II toxin-antitoxin system VapC family toxin [Chloroflexi bacterium]|nr:type II toxin-antitoxin system VapC family toxin [Chloroflexota bacterium]